MRCRIGAWLVALFVAAPTVGLAQTSSAPAAATQGVVKPDLSTPQSALASVYAALLAGDIGAARSCLSFKNAAQGELFDVTYAQLYGPLKLMHAMEAKFGAAGRQPFANGPLERELAATVEKVKTAQIEIDGERAKVVDIKAAINPSSESELTGIAFKKEGTSWKIVAATFSDVGDEMPADQMGFMRAMRDAVVGACEATEGRVNAGAFKTADEAYGDYQKRVQAGLQAALLGGAATQK